MSEPRPIEINDQIRRSYYEPVWLKDGGVIYKGCEMMRHNYEAMRKKGL